MRQRKTFPLIVLALLIVAVSSAFASDTTILVGQISGIELCPQSICESAIFSGVFQGTVNSRLAKGSFSASVNHTTPLPTTLGARPPLPADRGSS
jgi:hypothetical protein